MSHDVLPVLLTGIDDAWTRLRDRLVGITEPEYLWEPVVDVWTVRRVGDSWLADPLTGAAESDRSPAPVTTIAWRLWHLGSECFADYVHPSLGDWPLPVRGREWFGEPAAAVNALDTALTAFRDGVDALGPEGIWRPLGPNWGPFADSSFAALVVHAQDELSHHAAEIALLRDLYLRCDARPVR